MWKNLKSYFIVEEEGAKTTTKSAIPDKRIPAASHEVAPQPASPPGDIASSTATGRVADKFVEVLLQAMEKANLPGFDYLEYKKALQNLEKMNFDDALRFQTAYAAAQSMGVTPQQLIESAKHYLTTLQKEEGKFSAALANQRNDQIASKQQQLKELDASIRKQEEEIKVLTDLIAKTKKKKSSLQKAIGDSSAKIAATKADFEKTYQTIAGNIERDIARMLEYLK